MLGVTNICCRPSRGGVKIVTWADGTDEEIVAMVEAADKGDINLADHWHVGDERKVHLSAMAATGVEESHVEQDVIFVLMHTGGYKLSSGNTCSFVTGMKDALIETGYMNLSSEEGIDVSWESSNRRIWCNNTFKGAIPNTLLPIFKEFKTITVKTSYSTELQTSLDWFALPAAKEIFGGSTATSVGSATAYSNLTEFNSIDLFQFDWYKTTNNKIKKDPSSDSNIKWWERSPRGDMSQYFCSVTANGGYFGGLPRGTAGISLFGCI